MFCFLDDINKFLFKAGFAEFDKPRNYLAEDNKYPFISTKNNLRRVHTAQYNVAHSKTQSGTGNMQTVVHRNDSDTEFSNELYNYFRNDSYHSFSNDSYNEFSNDSYNYSNVHLSN